MSRKMTSAEFQRREFEKEVKKVAVLINTDAIRRSNENPGLDPVSEVTTEKRILRAYNIAEMRAALREEQQGGE